MGFDPLGSITHGAKSAWDWTFNDTKATGNFFKELWNGAGASVKPHKPQGIDMNNTELYNTSGSNANMPSLSDIRQGKYGDCYFLASLGALVQQDPEAVKNMIHDNGNGTYTVTFQHVPTDGIHDLWGLTGHTYTTKQFTVSAKDISKIGANQLITVTDNGKQVIWPAVVEAAYAKMHNTKVFGLNFGIDSGDQNISGGGFSKPAMQTLIGNDVQSYSANNSAELNNLGSQIHSGKLITVSTKDSDGNKKGYENGKNPDGLIGNHVYTVTDVFIGNDGQAYVKLNNPWGDDQPGKDYKQPGKDDGIIPLSDLPKYFDNITVGTD